jgi:SPP1 family predicted phage head-tail adaptor
MDDQGKFDRRITLQRATESDDGYATAVSSWASIATVWAQLVPLTGAERAAAHETAAFSRVNFRIRKASLWTDLNATDRVLYNSIAHDLHCVREDGRGFYILECSARAD